jgi:hypothetical protein
LLPSTQVPEATELTGDDGWALWDHAVDALNARFVETAPSSMPMRLAGGDPRYAQTMPAPLPRRLPPKAAPTNVHREPALDEVLLEARRGNRVCPVPEKWLLLYEILQIAAAGKPWPLPAPPLTGKGWTGTRALAKRMCFREQLEWAAAHGCVGKVFDFLQNLPESDWHYMGA